MRLKQLISAPLVAAVTFLMLIGPAQASRIERIGLISPGVGWVLSSDTLYMTNNDGKSWRKADLRMNPAAFAELVDAYFLSEKVGWVLFVHRDNRDGAPMIGVAKTLDGGSSWEVRFDIGKQITYFNSDISGSGGRIVFLDAMHGWINANAIGSSAMRPSAVIETIDGGKTWASPGPSGGRTSVESRNGEIEFIDAHHGWIASFDQLFGTSDGGYQWNEQELPLPKQWSDSGQFGVLLPVMTRGREAEVVAALRGGEANGEDWATLLKYRSDDWGAHWKIVSSAKPNVAFPDASVFAIRGKDVVEVHFRTEGGVKNGSAVKLDFVTVAENPQFEMRRAHSSLPEFPTDQVIFIDEKNGWATYDPSTICLSSITGCTQLMSTKDGGNSWSNISPSDQSEHLPGKPDPGFHSLLDNPPATNSGAGQAPRVGGSSIANPNADPSTAPCTSPSDKLRGMTRCMRARPIVPPPASPPSSSGESASTLGRIAATNGQPIPSGISTAAVVAAAAVASTSKHIAFDTILKPDQAILNGFWNYSPYRDFNLYVKAAHSSGATAQFATNVIAAGFGYWLTSVGLQPPQSICGSSFASFSISSTAAAALVDGQNDATNAISQATTTLGLPGGVGQVIYADLEHSNAIATATCQSVLTAYLTGWSNTLRAAGWKAGLYIDLSTGVVLLPLVVNQIDDIWIASSGTPGSRTIWNLKTNSAQICDPFAATNACETWASDQRSRQFLTDKYETWGNTRLFVDSDIIDAPVITGSGFKAANGLNAVGWDYPNSVQTEINAMSAFFPGNSIPTAGQTQQGNLIIAGATQNSAQASPGNFSGFIAIINPYTSTTSQITPINYSGSAVTSMVAVDSNGNGVGVYYKNVTDAFANSFYYSSASGTLTPITCSGATFVEAGAINDAGQIVGTAIDSANHSHGFYFPVGGTCVLVDVASSVGDQTAFSGINGQGVISGTYRGIPSVVAVNGYPPGDPILTPAS